MKHLKALERSKPAACCRSRSRSRRENNAIFLASGLLLTIVAWLAFGAVIPCLAKDNSLAPDECRIIVDDKEVLFADEKPYIMEGRWMVPIRPPMEAMGVEVFWQPELQQATLEQGLKYAAFEAGNKQYTVNDIYYLMDLAPQLKGGRMSFPLRYAAEAFGATLEWDQHTSTVLIAPMPAETAGALPGLDITFPEIEIDRCYSPEIKEVLTAVRADYGVPGISAAIINTDGQMLIASDGVRKRNTEVAVTDYDQWHMGSCTKAMTATMIAGLVERGYLEWDRSLAEAFPDLAGSMPGGMGQITLSQLLTHTSGLPENPDWVSMVTDLYKMGMSPRQCRMLCLQQAATRDLASDPGTGYLYSNLGYIVAAAMAEEATGTSWERLMQSLLYQPLGMTDAGFGGSGTPGMIDQPWPHDLTGEPSLYNSLAGAPGSIFWGPAGFTYCSLEDWSRFILDQMRGLRGEQGLLSPEAYQSLAATTSINPEYARGWMVVQREWGGGTVYTHSGTNLLNSSVVWMAPDKGFAVMVAANQGMSDQVAAGLDTAAGNLVNLALAR